MTTTLPSNLQNIAVIRENQRFGTYRAVDENGETVFVKQIRHPKLAKSLRKEIYGLERASQLNKMFDFPFATPKIKDGGGEYLITDWAEGETMEFKPGIADLSERINFLAESYAILDRATETVHPGHAAFNVPSEYENLARWLDNKIKTANYIEYFEPSLIEKSVQYLESRLPNLTARFTHADFTPHNVIENKEGKRTLIDWESANDLWPRFYDVVNFTFNKAIGEAKMKDGLAQLFYTFFEKIGSAPEAHLEQLNTIAAIRALSNISELLLEPDEHHNTTETMNETRAQIITEALENILADKPYIGR